MSCKLYLAVSQLLRNLANSFCMPARLALQLCSKPQHNRMSCFQLFSVFRPGIPVLLHSDIPFHCLETINHLNFSSPSSICSFSIFSNFNIFDTVYLLFCRRVELQVQECLSPLYQHQEDVGNAFSQILVFRTTTTRQDYCTPSACWRDYGLDVCRRS